MNTPDPHKPHDPEAQAEQARRDLERLQDTSEVVGTSAFVRAANKAKGHLSAQDKTGEDAIEVWGTRIARVLAILFVIYLIYTLLNLGR